MSGERRTTTSQPARLSPEDIATRAFSSAFRGVSEQEVRSFLRRVSEELQAAHGREQELRAELDALHERLRVPKPLDEHELLEALGEETAQLLRSAREAAKDIREKAEEAAARLRHDAQEEAQKLRDAAAAVLDVRTREADQTVAETVAKADAEVAELRASVEAEVAARRERTERDIADQQERSAHAAAAEIEAAKAKGRALHEQARAVRERVLSDLTHRRDLLQAQIAELRLGREHLVEAYRAVKRTFLDATEALTAVEVRFAEQRPEPVDPAEIEALLAGDALERAGEDLGEDLERDHDHEGTAGDGTPDPNRADATEAASPPEQLVGYVPPEANPPARGVDQLFARIRAEATAPAPARDEVSDPAIGAAAPIDLVAVEQSVATSGETPGAALATEPPPVTPTGESTGESIGTSEPDPVADTDGPGPVGPIDAALRALLAAATRRVKRLAQDEQNGVLDGLRRQKGRPSSAAVLASEEEQRAAWGDALAPSVADAYRISGARAVPDALATELAAVVFVPLRTRLVEAIDRGDEDGIADRVNARYREWKLQAMEGAVLDLLAAAHTRGVYDGAAGDARLAWLVAVDGCCADCADNALEPVRKGASFPTGTAHPPAHDGCRCTLAVLATTTTA